MPVRQYFIGFILIIAGGFISFLQLKGKYGFTAPIAILLLLVLGTVCAALGNQMTYQKVRGSGLMFSVVVSFCLFLVVYFIINSTGNSSLLTALVYTSCFLLPSIIFKNWQIYQLVFQPVEISPWLLPVPYVKSNAISLHLNSIHFIIRVAPSTGNETQEYAVTAPGIKTIGMVFSEMIYEQKDSKQLDGFSDIKDNPYKWRFFIREFGGLNNRQLDAHLSLLENRVKANAVVIAQRQ